jgi:hypothetical protein
VFIFSLVGGDGETDFVATVGYKSAFLGVLYNFSNKYGISIFWEGNFFSQPFEFFLKSAGRNEYSSFNKFYTLLVHSASIAYSIPLLFWPFLCTV